MHRRRHQVTNQFILLNGPAKTEHASVGLRIRNSDIRPSVFLWRQQSKSDILFLCGCKRAKDNRRPPGLGPPQKILGGEDDVGALPAELADGLAHDLLGATRGVDHGVVEEVDAMVVAKADPGAVGELAHFEAGPA
ncbi:hypothetical protein FF1_030484 [Malus domestica]